jgi:hypothetical protein
MKWSNHIGLRLEQLTDRCVPATVSFVGHNLIVSNPTVDAGATTIQIAQVKTNEFLVQDDGVAIGDFVDVKSLRVIGGDAKDFVSFDLDGFAFGGSITVSTGKGEDSVYVEGDSGGGINKNVSIDTGADDDIVGINSFGSILVLGRVTVNDSSGNDHINLGNSAAATVVLGDVSLKGMNTIRLAFGQPDIYRNFAATVAGDTSSLDFETVFSTTAINILGNLSLAGGPNDDHVLDSSIRVTGNASINLAGAATLNGNLLNAIQGAPPLHVYKNFAYTGGDGNDQVLMLGNIIDRNALVVLGDGNDIVDLSTLNGVFAPPVISGNLTIKGGDDNINFSGILGGGITAQVGGNLSIIVGNGHVSATVLTAPGKLLIWKSGDGSDSLTLDPTLADQTWRVNIKFGKKDDTLTLAGLGTQSIKGIASGGGHEMANTFTHPANWTLDASFVDVNFP